MQTRLSLENLYSQSLNICVKKENKKVSRRLFTSESVTEGHPDKICDQISDGVLDALLAKDPNFPCCLRNLHHNRHDYGYGRDYNRGLC